MKALSLRQPWLWAITHAGKRVENRSWPCRYRGPVLLHASKWWSQVEVIDTLMDIKALLPQSRWQQMQREITEGKLPLVSINSMKATRGSLLARAEIVDCLAPGSRAPEGQKGWYTGEYGLVLDKIELLPRPIPFVGSLGLFDVPDSVLQG